MYQELIPHPALQPFVDRFWTRTDSAAPRADPVRILPDGCIDIIVDCMQGGTGSLVGALTRAFVFAPDAPVRLVGVRFRPAGAVPFLRIAADELTDTRCLCADLGASRLVPPGLAEIDDVVHVARRFEASLLAKATRLAPPDPRVQYAVQAICAPSPPAIETLARRLGWTRQHLTRMIRAHVGVGPKHLARTARMQRAVTLLQRQPHANVADVAATTGYFDQAHMAGDFRALIGAAPRSMLDARGSIFPIRSLFLRA